MLPEFKYTRMADMPPIVRTLTLCFDAWVVGSSAKYMVGLADSCRDWDVIVPVNTWMDAARVIPRGSTNTFGGIKVISEGTEVDIWADDVGRYFTTVVGDYDLIAVNPRTQQVAIASRK